MIVLGITGGIATGKSTVTRMFADLGAPTASADDIARKLLAEPHIRQSLESAFPQCVGPVSYPFGHPLYDGPADQIGQYIPRPKINTNALRQLVFSDDEARKRLEAIMHPPIVDELKRDIARFRQLTDVPIAAVEIPLLFETGLTSIVDRVVVVAVDRQTQLTRLQERLGIDRAAAERQLQAQWPLDRKIKAADYVIDSARPVESMREDVALIWDSVKPHKQEP